MSINFDSLRNSVRDNAEVLCDTFDRDAFIQCLKNANLTRIAHDLDSVQAAGMLTPISVGNKVVYHFGHVFIAALIEKCTNIQYDVAPADSYDFEDVMMRRAAFCDVCLKYIREDADHLNNIFNWTLKLNNEFSLVDLAHTNTILEQKLEEIDPAGIYKELARENSNLPGAIIVRDLIKLQNDIEDIISQVNDAGETLPNVPDIQSRLSVIEALTNKLTPMRSPYLASPTLDIMVDERRDFIKTRNDLLISGKFDALAEHYENHSFLFENEVERHAAYCLALGYIAGEEMKDSAKAADYFQEALEYAPSNVEAFNLVSKHLREASKWDELVELLSNHWDAVDDINRRCEMLLECANIQAFHCKKFNEAIGLYERCMIEGVPGNKFDEIYKIVYGLMDDSTNLQRLRALVTLTAHLTNYAQCDKITDLQEKLNTSDEPAARCLNTLIEAGIISFKGDQPLALEHVREAYVLSPSTTITDGILYRVASKIKNVAEFNEAMDDIESESIPVKDLSNVLYRIASVLNRIPDRDELALSYAEHAVDADENNLDAINLAYELSNKLNNIAKKLVYASLKLAHTSNEKNRSDLETICDDLRVAIGDQDDSLIEVYEKCLNFESLRNSVGDDLKNLISSIPDNKAVSLLQRVESQCVTNGLKDLIGELYQSVLERDIEIDIRKSLLERYLGMLNGQTDPDSKNAFVRIHAQLFVLSPSTYLTTLLEKYTAGNDSLIRDWTGLIEDALPNVSDKGTRTKLFATLTHVYLDVLYDDENASTAASNILELDPSSVVAFKICFGCFERLEHYSECCDLLNNFPTDKLSDNERKNYFLKSLRFALVNLYDTDRMLYSLKMLTDNAHRKIIPILEKMISWQEGSDLSKDQLICFFETLENAAYDPLASALRTFRAEELAKEKRFDEVVNALFDEELKARISHPSFELNLIDRVKTIIRNMPESEERNVLLEAWHISDDAADTPQKITPEDASLDNDTVPSADQDALSNGSTDASADETIHNLLKECQNNPDADSTQTNIEATIKSLTPDDQVKLRNQLAEFYIKLGQDCENQKLNPQAEAYFKRAFQYAQRFELLEFYKRNRMFKKALRIASFKTAKATTKAAKASSLVDTALIYEAQRDFANAKKTLDEVVTKYSDAYANNDLINILRQRAAFALAVGDSAAALESLNSASDLAKLDLKLKGEIDVDICFLLRETGNTDEARKKWQSLMLRSIKTPNMQLLNLCFDIDNNKLTEAERKYEALLPNVQGTPLEIALLEQFLRIKQLKGEDNDAKQTAQRILEIDPANEPAKNALS